MINPARDSIEMQRLLAMILAEKEKREEEKKRARSLLDPFREDMASVFNSPILDPIKRDFGATFGGGDAAPDETAAEELYRRFGVNRLAELQKAQSEGDPEGPSFAARLQPHSLDESMYVPDAVEPAYPQDGGFKQEDMWAEFQRMNPGLNYAKVAQQAGGNVPGGNFSAMESTIKEQTPGASDAEFNKSIEELTQRQQMDSLLDPKSRSFNPAAAKVLLDRAGQKEETAAQVIYNRAQEMRGQAELDQATMIKRQYELSNTPEGKLGSTIDFILKNSEMRPDLFDKAIMARVALDNGDIERASKILQDITDSVGGQGELKSSGGKIG